MNATDVIIKALNEEIDFLRLQVSAGDPDPVSYNLIESYDRIIRSVEMSRYTKD